MDGITTNKFQGDQVKSILVVEDLLFLNIMLGDIDFVDENIIGELAGRNAQNYENIARLLRIDSHICYVNHLSGVSQSFCCSKCDTFLMRTINLTGFLN